MDTPEQYDGNGNLLSEDELHDDEVSGDPSGEGTCQTGVDVDYGSRGNGSYNGI